MNQEVNPESLVAENRLGGMKVGIVAAENIEVDRRGQEEH